MLRLLATSLGLQLVADAQFLPPLKQKILVPGYWAPCYNPNDPAHGPMECVWDQVCSDTVRTANASAIGNVILNPASGPGPACDAGWLNVSTRVHTADTNIGILGYTHTKYGNRSIELVEQEIDAYFTCYPAVSGIFLDEASGDCAQLPYYQSLYTYIRAKSASAAMTVVLNPGEASEACYLAVSDIIVTFEGFYSTYAGYTPAPWHLSNEASRFAHIVHNASIGNSEHLAAFRQSKTQNAGNVYITGLTLPNPYADLPQPYIYWDQELRWAVDII